MFEILYRCGDIIILPHQKNLYMEPEFLTYQKFDDVALANELIEVLKKHHIKYLMEEESLTFDPSYAFNPLSKDFAVKIRGEDFEHVRQLLQDDESEDINKIGSDYGIYV